MASSNTLRLIRACHLLAGRYTGRAVDCTLSWPVYEPTHTHTHTHTQHPSANLGRTCTSVYVSTVYDDVCRYKLNIFSARGMVMIAVASIVYL